jgi:single-stranded DNA-binding protein
MMIFLRVCALLSLAMALPASAKIADDYLHGGASMYIQGRIQEASVEVEEGLRSYPNDPKLKALAGQLRKMKDQKKQDQGGSDSQGGDGSKENKDKKDPEQGKDGQGQEQKQDQEKEKQDQKEKEGKDKEKDKGAGDAGEQPPKEDGKQGDSTGQAAPVPPGEMSKEEAERLLNSYQDDEKREQKNLQKRYKKPVEVEEDW